MITEKKGGSKDLMFRGLSVMEIIWTVLIIASLTWNAHTVKEETLSSATAAIRANIQKDLTFRRWATSHGGVYVPPSEHTPPNPYLKVPDRDVVTTSGKVLTLMNPAYVLRQIQEDYPEEFGMKSHITSLNPLNPKNAPDTWETLALESFTQGEKERSEVLSLNGKLYMRLMRPLYTEKGCLKCHGFQGYKVGDVRGGLSSIVPLSAFQAHEKKHIIELTLSHFVIWITGISGFNIWYRRNRRLSEAQSVSEAALRESENRYRSLVESSPLCIHEIDLAGKIISMNRAGISMMRVKNESDIQGFEYLNAVSSPDRERITELMKRAYKGETVYFEFKASGLHHQIFKSCFVPILSEKGEIEKLMGITEDVTEHRAAEEKLIAFKNELEHRVVERTAQLEAANKELEAFSYSVSHDLRTPLRAIDGFSLILLEDFSDKLDEEGKRLLNVVRNNTVRMSTLIDDILRFSRTGRTEMNFSETDMEAVVHDVLHELGPLIDTGKVRINVGKLPKAVCDRSLIRQVFTNLISNAVKFSSKKETPVVEISGSEQDGNNVYYVKDNGVGFDMKYSSKLFGVFQRLHGVDEFEGTGIGLAIVKRIIMRHEGQVWANGEVDKGSTFSFSIPRRNASGDLQKKNYV